MFRTLTKVWLALGLAVFMVPTLAKDLLFAVSEGSSGGTDHARVIAKYKGLADALGASVQRPVRVIFVREFSALQEGLQQGRFDLVMARPSDYPARAMRDHGYRYVAHAKPDGRCLIIVNQDSPLRTLADAQGKRFVFPDAAAYMTRFCAAELRTQGIDLSKVSVERVKEQGAIPFYLSNRFAEVGGVASYSGVARNLEKTGHRVLHQSVAQPYFPLVASQAVTATEVAAMQAALTALADSPAGQEVLKTVGIERFDTRGETALRALLDWLGP